MGKATWINVGGTWKQVKNVWENVGGIWKQKVKPKVNAGGSWKECMSYTDGCLYYSTSDFHIYKLDENGNQVFSVLLPDSVVASRLFIGMNDDIYYSPYNTKGFYIVNGQTGVRSNLIGGTGYYFTHILVDEDNDCVYAGTTTSTLYKYRISTGALIWATTSYAYNFLMLDENKNLYGCYKGNLYLINQSTGVATLKFPIAYSAQSGVQIYGGYVYTSNWKTVSEVNGTLTHEVWKYDLNTGAVTAGGNWYTSTGVEFGDIKLDVNNGLMYVCPLNSDSLRKYNMSDLSLNSTISVTWYKQADDMGGIYAKNASNTYIKRVASNGTTIYETTLSNVSTNSLTTKHQLVRRSV